MSIPKSMGPYEMHPQRRKVLHLCQDNPQCQNKPGVEGAGSSPSEKVLGMLVNGNWTEREENRSQQVSRGGSSPLLCCALLF